MCGRLPGDALRSETGKTESLKESVERDNRRQELEKQIAALQTKSPQGKAAKQAGAAECRTEEIEKRTGGDE